MGDDQDGGGLCGGDVRVRNDRLLLSWERELGGQDGG